MVRVIRNCGENTVCNVVLTLDQSSGAMQFVDNLDQFGTEGMRTQTGPFKTDINPFLSVAVGMQILLLHEIHFSSTYIELFFWVAKEGLGVQTKYLLVNANRTHVICIQHPHVIAEVRSAH